MKKYIFLLLLLSLSLNSFAQDTLYGTATKTWDVDTARQEAFQNIAYHVDLSGIPTIDPYLIQNKTIVNQGGGKIGQKVITVFDDGSYCVKESDNPIGYYYQADGSLSSLDVRIGDQYPIKEYKYIAVDIPNICQKGDLLGVSIATQPGESYTFKPLGQLSVHWIGSQCYNVNGSSCGTRKTYSY